MRKLRSILVLILVSFLLVSCGAEESAGNVQPDNFEYLDILAESGQILNVAEAKGIMKGKYLGMQFYKQEPVQIWAEKKSPEDSYGSGGVYIYKADGSRELLLEYFSMGDLFTTDWYIGTDGYYYLWNPVTFEKRDQSGEVLFTFSLKDLRINIIDVCQLPDGRLYMIISNGNSMENNPTELVEMDTATGEFTQINTISRTDLSSITNGGIAVGPDGLLIMTSEGVWALNVEDGSKTSVISFVGSSYQVSDMQIEDFRVTEDGKVEILQTLVGSKGGNPGYVETLELVDVSKEKVPITIRSIVVTKNVIGDWLKEQIVQFNQGNDTYHVVVQECEPGTDPADYARLTSVEISTGKGPDILLGQILEDYIYGMIEKGAFEDLSPYLENSRIRQEDYFPCAFNCWRDGDKIYGVNFWVNLDNYHIDEAVLGTREVPDVETLADALLKYEADAVFYNNWDSAEVLRYFLQGSEDLWGMIDWKKGTGDFRGELFAKLMEAAKRYGDDESNKFPALVSTRFCDDFVLYDSQAMQIETGKVTAGVLFDDGCYGAVRTDWILAVNSNSSNTEGAWQFISHLLGTEAQSTFHYTDALPVNREAFDILAKKPTEFRSTYFVNGVEYFKANASEVEEMIEFIEKVKPLPIRTVPIQDIICEEAASYFDGTKSLEEVIAVIENRVSLYLEENK